MFDSVLIAGRGEIARRITRTLHRMGITAVAVYSPADRDAPHVREADRAEPIDSYLDPDALLGACAATGAQALHPGYGFLSESPALVRACARAAVTFVGPGPEAMATMGDKLAAKAAARAAGLPVTESLTAEEARRAPAGLYPLLVKAAAGGGGRGMRVVAEPSALEEALAAAAREAAAGFGDARVFVERYLAAARHLEVQVIADAHGTVLHLGERECSLQRRHQKLVEESPSPAVDARLRARLGEEAVAVARAAGYVGAGTVEFIAEAADPARHFFLEMNARLQVEHPVTEAVTGLDLVELQLRVAAGERLPLAQGDVRLSGHAVEARVCAEDAERDFLPTGGCVLAYARPASGGAAGVRVDDAIEVGSVVSTEYDSLLAKVIAHGADRPQALARLDRALAATTILGVTTTAGYLRRLIASPEVAVGALTTGLVEAIGPLPAPVDAAGVARAAAILLVAERAAAAAATGDDDPFARVDGWRLRGFDAGASHWRLEVGGTTHEVDLSASQGQSARATGPGTFAIDQRGRWFLAHADPSARGGAPGSSCRADAARPRPLPALEAESGAVWIGHGGWAWPVRRVPAGEGASRAAVDGELRAPMPGEVLALPSRLGDPVRAGDPLIVLESMKMELTLAAPIDGTLAELAVAVGDRVVVEQRLARVARADGQVARG